MIQHHNSDNKETIYGFHAINAVLKTHPEHLQQLFLLTNRSDRRIQEIQKMAQQFAIPVQCVQRKELDNLVGSEVQHQGIVAHCKTELRYHESDLPQLLAVQDESLLLLILDGVQDPHNLGACLRTANAMGVNVVIAPKDRAVGMTPVVRKVACGAATITPFIQVTNLARTLRLLKEKNFWIIGSDAEAQTTLAEADFSGNIAIVMGGEGKGLRQLTQKQCDYLVRIPMQGTVNSLNVSVATAIFLYEARKGVGS